MTHIFNPTILREYDIRGIVGDTLTEADAYALGRSYGALAVKEGARRIAVGRDGRTHSGMLEAQLVRGLTDSGVAAVMIGQGPSPMLYFSTYHLDVDGGIQVTGSHNPADYNGFKMLLKGRSVFGQEIQALGARAAAGDWAEGRGAIEEVDVRAAYVDRLVEDFAGGEFRIGWDAGNGAAGPILEMLVDRLPGHSLIKSKMKETGAPLAGEMSGHIFFKHRWYGFDDALYAAVRMIEAVGQSGRSLTEIMDSMPRAVATPEMRFQVDESRKFPVVQEVLSRLSAEGAAVDATDGARVSTPDGWWLLRASNTQDVLVGRAEARDEQGLERLIGQIDEQLARSGVTRTEAAH
jgi:phosphomannomutase